MFKMSNVYHWLTVTGMRVWRAEYLWWMPPGARRYLPIVCHPS